MPRKSKVRRNQRSKRVQRNQNRSNRRNTNRLTKRGRRTNVRKNSKRRKNRTSRKRVQRNRNRNTKRLTKRGRRTNVRKNRKIRRNVRKKIKLYGGTHKSLTPDQLNELRQFIQTPGTNVDDSLRTVLGDDIDVDYININSMGNKDENMNYSPENNLADTLLLLCFTGPHRSRLWVEYLLGKGANINATVDNMTPLHIACTSNDVEGVRLLLGNRNINVNKPKTDANNLTTLHIACSQGYVDIVRLLLNHQEIDVNIRTGAHFRDTPLHMACSNGAPDAAVNAAGKDIVGLLLNNPGIDLTIENGDDSTPLDWACVKVTNFLEEDEEEDEEEEEGGASSITDSDRELIQAILDKVGTNFSIHDYCGSYAEYHQEVKYIIQGGPVVTRAPEVYPAPPRAAG